jgi:uncharacterized protein YecT (DUF1311 family)
VLDGSIFYSFSAYGVASGGMGGHPRGRGRERMQGIAIVLVGIAILLASPVRAQPSREQAQPLPTKPPLALNPFASRKQTLVPRVGEKPSFDCAQAKSAAARLICADAELAQLDGALGLAFQNRRNQISASDQSKLVAEQLAWIRERNSRCDLVGKNSAALEVLVDSKQCMLDETRIRIAALQQTNLLLPPFILAEIKYDGKQIATLQYEGLIVTVDSITSPDGNGKLPIATGRYTDRTVFSLRPDQFGNEEPKADVLVIRLDPATSVPQIILTYFWQGAHCCTVTKIATVDGSGIWHVVAGERLDGDGYDFKDLDGNGAAELISIDNSFLYAFASYAESNAPTRIQRLVGTALKDVTHETKYQGFQRQQLRAMEADATSNALWHSNGYLAGWVAEKSLVGELDDSWVTMLNSYDRSSDWLLEECLIAAALDKCPEDKKRRMEFPEALAKHLMTQGYITADQERGLALRADRPQGSSGTTTSPQPVTGSELSRIGLLALVIIGIAGVGSLLASIAYYIVRFLKGQPLRKVNQANGPSPDLSKIVEASSPADKSVNPDKDSLRWFYESKDGHVGPITTDAVQDLLLRGSISQDTLVWNKTFGQSWKSIRDTSFAGLSEHAPPPLPAIIRSKRIDKNLVPGERWTAPLKLSPLLILLLMAFVVWVYLGLPSPDTLLNWPFAQEQCVKFAQEHKELFTDPSRKIRAVNSWIKNGMIVVEIGSFKTGEDTYLPRICVVGGGAIQIVSILENNAWR